MVLKSVSQTLRTPAARTGMRVGIGLWIVAFSIYVFFPLIAYLIEM